MSMFEKSGGKSPVPQDFVWIGEYYDGTHLSEFDFVTKEENSFYKIQREKLIAFGLVGHGMSLFFTMDGVFYLNGKALEVVFRTKDKDYPLTGHHGKCRDIITFKDAEANFSPSGGMSGSRINQFNFGYKTELEIDGVKFHFKPICKIPYNQPVFMNMWLVADKDLDGELVILLNNREAEVIKAPLKKGVGGEVNWVVG